MSLPLVRGRMFTVSPAAQPARGRSLPLLLCLGGLAAAVAPAGAATMADPADASAVVPPPPVASALSAYRRWAPPGPRTWREVNDTVARIGGWRVYLREAQQPQQQQQPDPAPSPPLSPSRSATPPAPTGQGHGGHGSHGRR